MRSSRHQRRGRLRCAGHATNSCIASAAGQFTQPDPIGLAGGLNLYGYADGDPINKSDPFGLCTKDYCPSLLDRVYAAARQQVKDVLADVGLAGHRLREGIGNRTVATGSGTMGMVHADVTATGNGNVSRNASVGASTTGFSVGAFLGLKVQEPIPDGTDITIAVGAAQATVSVGDGQLRVTAVGVGAGVGLGRTRTGAPPKVEGSVTRPISP